MKDGREVQTLIKSKVELKGDEEKKIVQCFYYQKSFFSSSSRNVICISTYDSRADFTFYKP